MEFVSVFYDIAGREYARHTHTYNPKYDKEGVVEGQGYRCVSYIIHEKPAKREMWKPIRKEVK